VAGVCGGTEPSDAPVVIDTSPIDTLSDATVAHTIPPGAVLWLKCDDDATDGALDSAGTHMSSCASCPGLEAGQFASAYVFTTDRIVEPPTNDLMPNTAFTIAAWVRLDAAPSITTVVACKGVGSGDCSYALLIDSNRTPRYFITGGNAFSGAAAFPLGTWHHLAMTWDGTMQRGYYDGVADGNKAVSSVAADAAQALSIGERILLTPLSLAGALDDIVFYNRALSATEIAQLATPP
jgi:hypothetical protein